jgi:hypothetical protein
MVEPLGEWGSLLSRGKIVALLVLSILILLIIVSIIKLTTVTSLPSIDPSSTTVVDTATWEIDRPSMILALRSLNQTNRTFADQDFTANVKLEVAEYLGDWSVNSAMVYIALQLEASGSASSPEYVNYTFHVNDMNSSTIVSGSNQDANCSVINQLTNWSGGRGNDTVIVLAANSTSCFVRRPIQWILYDKDSSIEHSMNVTVECIYKNRSSDKKVVFPMILRLLKDAGNDFSTAENISFGEYHRTLESVDWLDFFAMLLQKPMTINISVISPQDTQLNVTLFNPNHISVYQEISDTTFSFIHEVSVTGTWHIEVQLDIRGEHVDEGVYSIEVRMI